MGGPLLFENAEDQGNQPHLIAIAPAIERGGREPLPDSMTHSPFC
jgi:hypothetical protein